MKPVLHLTLLLLSLTIPDQSFAQTRTFTNDKGNKIEAEIVEVNGDKVVLKLKGRNYPVPINTLSDADKTYIKDWQKSKVAPKPKGNWDAEWPKGISVDVSQEIEIIQENPEGYIYASEHYEFRCNVKLNKSVVRRFALLFEATNQYMRELPLGMVKPHSEKRFVIRLFETHGQYVKAGAPSTSAGVYFGGSDQIWVPLTSLGVKKVASSYSVDYKKENGTLSHEICHQITDPQYYAGGSRGWFTEGLAEYIKLSGYRSGKFNVNDRQKIIEYVTEFDSDTGRGRNLGKDIRMPRFQQWANQSYSSFLSDSQRNYGVGCLVTYYFFHMDGERDAANIKAFLKELKKGKKGNEALKTLLAGRTFEELEADITKNWRSRGIKISWGK